MDIKSIIESLSPPITVLESIGKAPVVVMPDNYETRTLEDYLPAPTRTRVSRTFVERDSFIDYCKRFLLPNSLTFCKRDSEGLDFCTVFDHDTREQPSWASHKAYLELAYHPDYMLLKSCSDKWFDQEEFALFIEGNTHLFLSPSAADMLELAQDLRGTRTLEFANGKRLSSGGVHLEYIEKVEARASRIGLDIPESISLVSPIFDGQKAAELKAAFRWRQADGGVKFSFRLLSTLEERAAVESVRTDIETEFKTMTLQVDRF